MSDSGYQFRVSLSTEQVNDLVKFWREHGDSINAGNHLSWRHYDHLRLILVPDLVALDSLKYIAEFEIEKRKESE